MRLVDVSTPLADDREENAGEDRKEDFAEW